MTGAVTYEQVQWFVAELFIVATLLIAIWKPVAGRITEVEKKAAAAVDKLEEDIAQRGADLSAFKLEVAQKYASQQHLKDTEERLVSAINKLEATIAAMPASIAALIKSGQRATQRRT